MNKNKSKKFLQIQFIKKTDKIKFFDLNDCTSKKFEENIK